MKRCILLSCFDESIVRFDVTNVSISLQTYYGPVRKSSEQTRYVRGTEVARETSTVTESFSTRPSTAVERFRCRAKQQKVEVYQYLDHIEKGGSYNESDSLCPAYSEVNGTLTRSGKQMRTVAKHSRRQSNRIRHFC